MASGGGLLRGKQRFDKCGYLASGALFLVASGARFSAASGALFLVASGASFDSGAPFYM